MQWLQLLQPAPVAYLHAEFSGTCVPFHARDFGARPPRRDLAAAEMRQHAFAQIQAFADVQSEAALREKRVYPGRPWQEVGQIGGQAGRKLQFLQLHCNGCVDLSGIEIAVYALREIPQHACIGERAMPVVAGDAVARNELIQTVALLMRIQAARQAHRAQHIRRVVQPGAAEFVLQKSEVKARVMRHQRLAGQAPVQFPRQFREGGRIGHHGVADAGQGFNKGRNRLLRINQGTPFANELSLVNFDQPDFRDAIRLGGGTGGFQIQKYQRALEHYRDRWLGSRATPGQLEMPKSFAARSLSVP